jgi:hypothetical protein
MVNRNRATSKSKAKKVKRTTLGSLRQVILEERAKHVEELRVARLLAGDTGRMEGRKALQNELNKNFDHRQRMARVSVLEGMKELSTQFATILESLSKALASEHGQL